MEALSELFPIEEREKLVATLHRDRQARTRWGTTYVDLFFSSTAFHDAMSERVERRPFDGADIPVLAIEDLLVAKLLYGSKDWLDLEAVVAAEGERLDSQYIHHWVDQFVDHSDPRIPRLNELIPRHATERGNPQRGS